LTKIDSNGTLLWQKCIGGSDGEYATVCNIIDSNYIVAGITHSYDGDVTNSFNHGNGDAWVLKLAQLTDDVSSLIITQTNLTGFITSSILHLNYSATIDGMMRLQLFDITGRLLFEKTIPTIVGRNELVFPIGEVNTGVYVLRTGNEACKVIAK
jgi:hypothetical protein